MAEYIVRVLNNGDCITEDELVRCRDCVFHLVGYCSINYARDEEGKAVHIKCGDDEFCCWAERRPQ